MPNEIAQNLMSSLNAGDIVEVTCMGFYHYCIYLGDGLCAHITKKGTHKTAQTVESFCSAVGENPVRLYNFEEKAKQLGLVTRNSWEMIDKASEGLERDSNGQPKAGTWRHVEYNVIFNNCEMFVTYCRYECPSGWSEQAQNIWKAFTGAISTGTNVMITGCARALGDESVPIIAKAGVVVAAPVYAIADIAAGTASDVFNPITSTLNNVVREAGTISRDREATEGSYETGLGIGYKAETTKESVEAHWSVLSAGLSSPSASTETYVGLNGAQAEIKAELFRGEAAVGPVSVGVGLQVDSGFCVKKGKVGASLLGFGGEIGESGIKLKTPIADASCCIA